MPESAMPTDTAATATAAATGTVSAATTEAAVTDVTHAGAENPASRSLDDLPAEYAWVAKQIRDANREAQNLRSRLKDAEPAAAKLREMEDAQRSEAEKTAARLTAAETERDRMTTENQRLRIAIEKSLPVNLIDRLRGDDEDALRADADALLALVNSGNPTSTPTAPKPAPKPAPDLSQGARGDGASPAELFGQVFGN